jgi:hypothetical protein
VQIIVVIALIILVVAANFFMIKMLVGIIKEERSEGKTLSDYIDPIMMGVIGLLFINVIFIAAIVCGFKNG